MSELDQLRQEAEQLKNQIRVSPSESSILPDFLLVYNSRLTFLSIKCCARETETAVDESRLFTEKLPIMMHLH